MLELQDDGVLGPAKEHPTAFRVELPQYSQQLRLLDGEFGRVKGCERGRKVQLVS